jgi:predicted nuclease of predicted toxin-antitoxin system
VKVWLDAQLPPALCGWLASEFGLEAVPLRDLGLRDARDRDIFEAARAANVIVMSKDADFAELVMQRGPPPQILWVSCGNTTNEGLRQFLSGTLSAALQLIETAEPLVRLVEVRSEKGKSGPAI